MSTAPELDLPERIQLSTKSEAAKILLAIRKARKGDPIPLVELLWGDFIILDEWQERELREFFSGTIREMFIKGNTGCGKGAFIGLVVCLYYVIFKDARIVLTRDSKETAVSILFAEVCKWWNKMRFKPQARILADKIQDVADLQHIIEVRNPGSGEGFSGAHSPHTLFVFDEATAAVLEEAKPGEQSRYDLADTQCTHFLACANPRTTSGRFRESFPSDDPNKTQTIPGRYGNRRLVTVGGKDCMNVRLKCLSQAISPIGGIEIKGQFFKAGEPIPDEYYRHCKPIIPGQTCYDTYMGHKANPDPNFAMIFADGNFPDADPEKQLIVGHWLEASKDRWRRFNAAWAKVRRRHRLRKLLEGYFPVEALALDVAASADGDETCLTVGGTRGIRKQHVIQERDTTKAVQWVLLTMRSEYGIDLPKSGLPIAVDMDGVGKGVGDMLKELGCNVIEIHGAATPEVSPESYFNKRAESYGEFAKRYDPAGTFAGQPFLLPTDEWLTKELCAHEKLYVKRDAMKFRVTPKSPVPGVKDVVTVKQKIGRSPDRSDSAVYFYRALQAKDSTLQDWFDAGAF